MLRTLDDAYLDVAFLDDTFWMLRTLDAAVLDALMVPHHTHVVQCSGDSHAERLARAMRSRPDDIGRLSVAHATSPGQCRLRNPFLFLVKNYLTKQINVFLLPTCSKCKQNFNSLTPVG